MSANNNDIQLKGTNLCNIELDCQNRDSVLHPETCADNTLTTHDGSVTLTEWLTYNETDPTTPLDGFGSYAGLIPWLEHYYPHNNYSLPAATTTTLGGIIVGNNLAIEDGVLSLDATIPTITKASFGTNTTSTDYTVNGYGTIKLGNDTVISSDFGNSTISYDSSYKFPLRLDSKGRAGIEINAALFNGQEQSNWYQTDNTQPDYIKNKPDLATVATTGSYNDLIDKPAIGQVNNGVLTIKYGNTTLSTFSANADSNTTVIIPIGLNYLPVDTLPTENISTTTIYMLPKSNPETGDYYDEWMYINRGTVEVPNYNWERVGNTQASSYTAGDGIDITSNVISQTVATDNTIGGIKTGYTKNDNKKPVQLDANNKAYVDTEQHLTIGGMITNGLSAHFYRVGTGSNAGSFTQNTWIPIIMSTSNNIGKCSIEFEIFGREDGKTSYGKYYMNHMSTITNKLLCLSFWSEDTNHFDYDDIRAAKYAIDNNNVTIVVYKKVKDVSDSMFIVNILAENTPYYSTQHYFYTGSSSISDANYLLTRTDLRIGTMNADTQSITAKLINDESASSVTMDTIGATNATYYTTT